MGDTRRASGGENRGEGGSWERIPLPDKIRTATVPVSDRR